MKKRAMKKWIPKDTCYCYSFDNKNGLTKCKWRRYIETIEHHRDADCKYKDDCDHECWTTSSSCCKTRVYRCEYLNYTDWNEDSLIWDACKECGVKVKYV